MKWKSAYINNGQWYKGNCHIHTNVSDGGYSPEETTMAYQHMGKMDFIVLTDHNSGNLEKTHPELAVDAEELSQKYGITVISGREDSFGRHVVGLGVPMKYNEDIIGKPKDEYTIEDDQKVIDLIRSEGGLAYIAHPHWKYLYWPKERIVQLTGVTGVEILNGDRFGCVHVLATDVWDYALTAGMRLWGIGNDDCHSAMTFMNAWNIVKAHSNSAKDILDALAQGSCYVTNGAEFESIEVKDDWIIVECSRHTRYANCDKTFRFIGEEGKILQTQTGYNPVAAYRGTGEEKYVRVEMVLNWGMSAFTQPFYPDNSL